MKPSWAIPATARSSHRSLYWARLSGSRPPGASRAWPLQPVHRPKRVPPPSGPLHPPLSLRPRQARVAAMQSTPRTDTHEGADFRTGTARWEVGTYATLQAALTRTGTQGGAAFRTDTAKQAGFATPAPHTLSKELQPGEVVHNFKLPPRASTQCLSSQVRLASLPTPQ